MADASVEHSVGLREQMMSISSAFRLTIQEKKHTADLESPLKTTTKILNQKLSIVLYFNKKVIQGRHISVLPTYKTVGYIMFHVLVGL